MILKVWGSRLITENLRIRIMLVSVLHHYINSMMKISIHLIRYAVIAKSIETE